MGLINKETVGYIEIDLLKEILTIHISQTNSDISAIKEAVTKKDLETIIFKAHHIRSSSLSIGAEDQALAAQQMEHRAKDGVIPESNDIEALETISENTFAAYRELIG